MNGAEFLKSKGVVESTRTHLGFNRVAELLDEYLELRKNVKQYVIISLKHTTEDDHYVTFWRPDNTGYCESLEQAGLYETPEKGYHDNEENRPVEYEKVKALVKTTNNYLLNNGTNLRRLGINI